MDDIVVSDSMRQFLHGKAWYLMKNINHVIGATIITIIFCIELYFVVKAFKKINFRDDNIKNHILLSILPLLIYVGNMLSIFCGPMADWAPWTLSCLLWCQIAIVLWLINKCLLYLLLLLRINTIYKNTIFSYNGKFLLCFGLIIIIETLIMSIFAPINTSVDTIHFNDIDGIICEMTVGFIFLGIATFVDIIVSFLTLYLFLKPLSILQQQQEFGINGNDLSSISPKSSTISRSNTKSFGSTTNENKRSDDLYGLMIKYCTLTVIMVLSTFLILTIIGLFDTISIGTIDVTINCICIALFEQRYHKYFKKICCGGIIITKSLTYYCCQINWKCKCKKNQQNVEKNLSEIIDIPDSPKSMSNEKSIDVISPSQQ